MVYLQSHCDQNVLLVAAEVLQPNMICLVVDLVVGLLHVLDVNLSESLRSLVLLLRDLYAHSAHTQRLSDVRRNRCDLLPDVVDRRCRKRLLLLLQPLVDYRLDLRAEVRLEYQSVASQPRLDLRLQLLWEVHRVRYHYHRQLRLLVGRPVDQVVEDLLVRGHQVVTLVDQEDPVALL